MAELEDSPIAGPTGRRKVGAGAKPPRRGSGVGGKPIAVQQAINAMLEAGEPYDAILKKLGPDAEGLSQEQIQRWHKSGFREAQINKARLQEFEERREASLQAAKAVDLSKATPLDLAAAQIYEVLAAFDIQKYKESLNKDAGAYPRFLNALARISAETLKHERRRLETSSGPRGIQEATLDLIEQELKLF